MTAQAGLTQTIVLDGRQPRRRSNVGFRILDVVGIVVIVVYCLAPFYWMIVSSLRRPSDMFSLSLWPDPLSFDNYQLVFGSTFMHSLLNSLIVAGITTLLALAIAITTSYALARLQFRGSGS